MVTEFHESNFDTLPSQSSIYGVTSICGSDGTATNLLLGLSKGKIFSNQYNKVSTYKPEIQRVFREISFTYIPNKCHIISVDSFGCAERGLIVGVTFCQGTENYLNIYCNDNYDINRQEWNLDKVAQTCCRSIHLEFTPYQLTNFKVNCPKQNTEKTVFLLLGGDKKIHVYAQETECVDFGEESLEDYFPELINLPEIPTYLEQQNISTISRLDVVGFANGTVSVYLVDKVSNNVISTWTVDRDSPITQVQIIQKVFQQKDCKFKSCANKSKLPSNTKNDCNIIVISAREDATLYRNVCKVGLNDPLILSGSGDYDCPTCCEVANTKDPDNIEILIGTYGQRLLVYNCHSTEHSFNYVAPVMQRKFAFPIVKLKLLDMTCDGVQELSVITTRGVHAFQYELCLLLNKFKELAS